MRLSTSEQIRIELKRKNMTQIELAEELSLTKVSINIKLRDNIWKPAEIYMLKHKLGFDLI